jgi:plasmid stabilization system protein ParE
MAFTIALKPGAEDDIEHAYNWYEDQRLGLGEEFLEELIVYYRKLELQPTAFGKLNRMYRRAILKQFPYVIIFEINKTEVIIYAVFHKSRSPKNRLRRR